MAFDLGSILSGAGGWAADNPLAVLAGAGDIFSLINNINSSVQANNAQQKYQGTAAAGYQPNVNTIYQPMTDAQKQAYIRGITANAQQNIPVTSQAFNDLVGTNLAATEDQRRQWAAQQAYQQWLGQQNQQQNVYQTTARQAGGAPGQNLMQYLIMRSLMDARSRGDQTGQAYNPAQVGQTAMPDPYSYAGGTFTPQGAPSPGASPFGSVQYGDTSSTEPSFGATSAY